MEFHKEDHDIIRSSNSQIFSKICALKKFAIFTGKRLCGPQACNFIQNRLLDKCFPCAYCKSFKYNFFYRRPLVAASLSSDYFSYINYLHTSNFLTSPFLSEEILL